MGTNENCYQFPLAAEIGRGQRGSIGAAYRSLLCVVLRLQFWSERASQRRRLAELDVRMLKDIGLSRADVARESGKRFWQD